MDKQERIDLLREAQEKLDNVIYLISEAVKDTDLEASADAYILGHLRNWNEGNNPNDRTAIPYLIEDVLNMSDEEEILEWDGKCPICGCESCTVLDDEGILFRCDVCKEKFNV